jgi:hypothetical protein
MRHRDECHHHPARERLEDRSAMRFASVGGARGGAGGGVLCGLAGCAEALPLLPVTARMILSAAFWAAAAGKYTLTVTQLASTPAAARIRARRAVRGEARSSGAERVANRMGVLRWNRADILILEAECRLSKPVAANTAAR